MQFLLKRVLVAVYRYVIQTVARVLATFLIGGVCLMITLRYLGIPLPVADELLRSLDGLSELARILS